MTTNTNPDTGIRFGVIALNSLDPDTAAWLWDTADNISEEEAIDEIREQVNAEVEALVASGELDESDSALEADRRCDRAFEQLHIEEPYLEGECEGVKYGISHLGGAPLLWVYQSPYITHRSLCSPCVPGAVDLDSSPNSQGTCGYDVPPDWRGE